jgi:hypothetical protein
MQRALNAGLARGCSLEAQELMDVPIHQLRGIAHRLCANRGRADVLNDRQHPSNPGGIFE